MWWKSTTKRKALNEALPAVDETQQHLIENDKSSTGLLLQELASRLETVQPRQCSRQGSTILGSDEASTRSGPVLLPIGYTKFTIAGFKGVKHAIFVKKEQVLTPAVFQQICAALGKEAPAQFLSGVGPVKHPSKMTSEQLRRTADFKPLVLETLRDLAPTEGRARERSPGEDNPLLAFCSSGGQDEVDPEVLRHPQVAEAADLVLEKKLERSVSMIAEAAARANAWCCTGPRVTDFELFLQAVVEDANSEHKVTRMVVAHLQDKAYMECDTAKGMLRELYDSSQPMSAEVVERSSAVSLRGDLWSPKHNRGHAEFAQHGNKLWSFSTYDDPKIKGHPVAQWPWPSGEVFLFVYHGAPDAGTPDSNPDWSFKTKTALDPAIPFAVDSLAPMSYVFMGGSMAGMKRKLMSVLTAPTPTVFVDQTDGLTKQASILVKMIKAVNAPYPLVQCDKFLSESALSGLGVRPSINQLLQALMPSKMLAYMEKEYDPSGMPAEERLNMGDLVHILELMKRRPLAFNQRLTSVDPFQDARLDSGKVSQLVSALTSHHMTAQECKNAAVGRALTMKGWRLHRKLATRATSTRRSFVAVSAAVSALLFLCTAIAVCIAGLRLQKLRYDDVMLKLSTSGNRTLKVDLNGIMGFVKMCMVLLTIIAGLLVTLQSHFQLSLKSANMQMAADHVVSDVNLYIGRVGPYAGDRKESQRLFMKCLRDIVGRLAMAGINEDGVLAAGSKAEEQFPTDLQELEHHVESYVYATGGSRWTRRLKDFLARTGALAVPRVERHLLEATDAVPDYAAEFTAESYMELRFEKVRRHFQDRLKLLTRRRRALTVFMLATLALSTVLLLPPLARGADISRGLCLWVPIPISLVTLSMAIQHMLAPEEAVSVLRNSLTVLGHVDLRWAAADIHQRRSPKMLHNLVTTTERVWCSAAACLSGAALFLDEPDEAVWEGERVALKRQAGQARRRGSAMGSRPMSRSMSLVSTPTDLMSVFDVESQAGS